MCEETIKQSAARTIDFRELRRYRLGRVQERLHQSDVGAAILFEPQNIRYATDLTNANLIWTFYTPVRYAFVPADGLPIMFEYALDTCPVSADDLEFVGDVRPSTSFATFYRLDGKAPFVDAWCAEIESLVGEHCGGNRRLAIDALSPTACAAIVSRGFEVVDGDGLMARARLIKSAEEIKCLRAAVRVADLGARRVREKLRPGITEQQLWAVLHATNTEQGGEWIETRLLTSGTRTNPWYQSASEKVIEPGDLVVFDTDMVGPFGYVGDISRAYLCADRPTGNQKRTYGVAYENLHHNLELLKPGVSFRQIAERSFEPPEAFRAYQEAVGHGAGVQIEFPLLCTREEIHRMPYPDMTLEPGMVICAEAYAGEAGGVEGVKLEQQVVITPSGHEVLSDLPFEDALLN
jgi:Xaa-Pro aminopeptidase